MNTTIEARLNEELNKKEEELEKAKKTIARLSHLEDNEWQQHKSFKHEGIATKMPFPRIEMRLNRIGETWHKIEWVYGIVYRHFTDRWEDNSINLIFVPLSKTNSTGGNGTFESRCRNGKLDTPFCDGLYIKMDSSVFNLPAFIVCYEMQVFNQIELNFTADNIKIVEEELRFKP